MTLDNLIYAIAKQFDCKCEFEKDGETILLENYSPAGQDVVFEYTMTDLNSSAEYVEALQQNAESFDPEEEATLWIGEDGHGKNGAPYYLRDLIDDMDWVKDFYLAVAHFAQEL